MRISPPPSLYTSEPSPIVTLITSEYFFRRSSHLRFFFLSLTEFPTGPIEELAFESLVTGLSETLK